MKSGVIASIKENKKVVDAEKLRWA